MGVKQSKRSVDITETSTKGEIEGFGNEGKVEKIIDGIVEKVGVNGHVDGELQNGIEPIQNGVEAIQNGEAAPVVKKLNDESPLEMNAQLENGEMNGEAEKIEDPKKTEEKKENEKKGKGVKKKFSIRYFSFSKKDKSKPPKEEKSPEKAEETPAEEAVTASPENEVQTSETIPETPANVEIHTEVPEPTKPEVEALPSLEKIPEMSAKTSEELPPPLPASPPPSEPIEGKIVSEMDKLDLSEPASENPSAEMTEVASSISSILTEKTETMTEVMKDVDQIVMETGKQIEEKATNLLKTVEERAEEAMRTGGEMLAKKVEEVQEMCQNELGMTIEKVEMKEEVKEVVDEAKKLEEGVPVEISSLGSLTPKEEQTDKHEEGAGESLADMPKDLTDEATATSVEESNPDSLEVPPPPPPVVEAVTGE